MFAENLRAGAKFLPAGGLSKGWANRLSIPGIPAVFLDISRELGRSVFKGMFLVTSRLERSSRLLPREGLLLLR